MNTLHLIYRGDYYKIDYDLNGNVLRAVMMPQKQNQRGTPIEFNLLEGALQDYILHRIAEEITNGNSTGEE